MKTKVVFVLTLINFNCFCMHKPNEKTGLIDPVDLRIKQLKEESERIHNEMSVNKDQRPALLSRLEAIQIELVGMVFRLESEALAQALRNEQPHHDERAHHQPTKAPTRKRSLANILFCCCPRK